MATTLNNPIQKKAGTAITAVTVIPSGIEAEVGVVVQQPYRRKEGQPNMDELFTWTAEQVAQWLTNSAGEGDDAAAAFIRHEVW